MDHKDSVKSGYNKIAERYLSERSWASADVRLLNDFFELLAANSKVLDAGCGAGVPITLMLSERFNVIGVDFSETQIELAKRNVPNAQFICTDMTRLDFRRESLDGICSYYAIIHIPRKEHEALLTRFYGLLKFGGVALLCLGAEDLSDDFEEDFLGAAMYWSHYNANTYIKLLKAIGYVIVWAKHIPDESCEGASHLFALVQKGMK